MQIIQLCDLYIISGTEELITPRTRRHPSLGSFSPGRFTYRRYGVMEMKTVCWTVAVLRPRMTTPATTRRMPRWSVCQVDFVFRKRQLITSRIQRKLDYDHPSPIARNNRFNCWWIQSCAFVTFRHYTLFTSVCVLLVFVLFCFAYIVWLFFFFFFFPISIFFCLLLPS